MSETKVSLDVAARPGFDELVPSHYALKVGEVDVLVISDGVLSALPAATLGVNAGPTILKAWLDDMVLPRMVHVVFVRSPHAHAAITGIDASAALALPGVLRVFTGKGEHLRVSG